MNQNGRQPWTILMGSVFQRAYNMKPDINLPQSCINKETKTIQGINNSASTNQLLDTVSDADPEQVVTFPTWDKITLVSSSLTD